MHVYTLLSSTAQDGFSPLYAACFAGHTAVVDTLLKGGAQPNLATMVLDIPAFLHASDRASVHHFHSLSQDGASPLLAASNKGHTEIVDILLKKGANLNPDTTVRILYMHVHCVHCTALPNSG